MKFYLVKTTSIATQQNPNFAGQILITYEGKDQTRLKREGTNYPEYNRDVICGTMLYEYGYRRECDAKRSYAYRNPENDAYWTSAVEIVEYEI